MNAVPAFDGPPLVEPAYDILAAAGDPTPLVYASPHSGRLYPADMMAASGLTPEAIRRSEDAYVDRLVRGAAGHGAALIRARYARAYVDVNREPYELDPAMYEDELPAFARSRTARVVAGLGAIARVVAEGQEIYTRKLTFAEARARIEGVHRPYHAALQGLLNAAKARSGVAVLIDWHSMPGAAAAAHPARGGQAPDFVLGDRFGGACSGEVTALVERTLEAMGYVTARNAPYAGGYTTEFYGRPGRGVHALQIEISRALYLDEATMRPGARCEAVTADLDRLHQALGAHDWTRLA